MNGLKVVRTLGNRMKLYEEVFYHKLPIRMPVIIRLDGNCFHTIAKRFNLKKPFDDKFIASMDITAKELCEEIQGTKVAYIQSDEISLLLNNYTTLETEPWFNNEIQKIVSISAGKASVKLSNCLNNNIFMDDYIETVFDSRAFVLTKDEVCNYFIWRQRDWERNSLQMVARSYFPHKELLCLDSSQLHEKLFKEKGVNWSELLTHLKRGRCVVKDENNVWRLDYDIPRFQEDRDYINKHLLSDQ